MTATVVAITRVRMLGRRGAGRVLPEEASDTAVSLCAVPVLSGAGDCPSRRDSSRACARLFFFTLRREACRAMLTMLKDTTDNTQDPASVEIVL